MSRKEALKALLEDPECVYRAIKENKQEEPETAMVLREFAKEVNLKCRGAWHSASPLIMYSLKGTLRQIPGSSQ
mgnify:FL=1